MAIARPWRRCPSQDRGQGCEKCIAGLSRRISRKARGHRNAFCRPAWSGTPKPRPAHVSFSGRSEKAVPKPRAFSTTIQRRCIANIDEQLGIDRKNHQHTANSDKTFRWPVPNLTIIR
jgi:hypothetical protein